MKKGLAAVLSLALLVGLLLMACGSKGGPVVVYPEGKLEAVHDMDAGPAYIGTPAAIAGYYGPRNGLGRTMAFLPGGKVLRAMMGDNGTNIDLLLVRYNQDGTLDGSFGQGGIAAYDSGWDEGGLVLDVMPDGRIVVLGLSQSDAYGGALSVMAVRFRSNGTLDTAFGTGGAAVYGTDAGDIMPGAMRVQPDGKVLVAGELAKDYMVVRFNADGTLDTGFGTDGVALYDYEIDTAYALALQPDGKIIVGGTTTFVETRTMLVRLLSDGTPDLTFAYKGAMQQYPLDLPRGSDQSMVFGLETQPDGKILLVNYATDYTTYESALVRFTRDGELDPTFGTDGQVVFDAQQALILSGPAIQADGRILVAAAITNVAGIDMGVYRYNADGTPDTTFGTDGMLLYDNGQDEIPLDVEVQPTGTAYVAGAKDDGLNATIFVLKVY